MSAWMIALPSSEEFHSPGPADFEFPPFVAGITKPMLIVVVGTILIGVFFFLAVRRVSIVPGKLQFAAEGFYGFVRNSIATDAIGREGIKYVPYLATAFAFLITMNIAGIVPFAQFPASARIAIPMFLALITWVIYNYVGIKRQGFGGYFKNMMFPAGVPAVIYPILAPIEFLSTVVFRPITLTLRLTFNMFAGHLVLLLCILGGEFLLLHVGGLIGYSAGAVAILFGIVMTFFEGFVQLLQAYVFVLLSAIYIGGALTHDH